MVLTPQTLVKHLDGRRDETPASSADRSTRATRSNFVVICHINIEHQLSELRTEGVLWYRFTVPWLSSGYDLARKHDVTQA